MSRTITGSDQSHNSTRSRLFEWQFRNLSPIWIFIRKPDPLLKQTLVDNYRWLINYLWCFFREFSSFLNLVDRKWWPGAMLHRAQMTQPKGSSPFYRFAFSEKFRNRFWQIVNSKSLPWRRIHEIPISGHPTSNTFVDQNHCHMHIRYSRYE